VPTPLSQVLKATPLWKVRREVGVLRALAGGPGVVRLLGTCRAPGGVHDFSGLAELAAELAAEGGGGGGGEDDAGDAVTGVSPAGVSPAGATPLAGPANATAATPSSVAPADDRSRRGAAAPATHCLVLEHCGAVKRRRMQGATRVKHAGRQEGEVATGVKGGAQSHARGRAKTRRPRNLGRKAPRRAVAWWAPHRPARGLCHGDCPKGRPLTDIEVGPPLKGSVAFLIVMMR